METYLGENFIPLKLERRKILTENLEVIGSLGSNLLILEFIKTMRVNMITDRLINRVQLKITHKKIKV